MKNIYTAIISLILSSLICKAGLLFSPPVASVIEPRIGSFYQTDDERLRLDIGYSMDMARLIKNSEYEMNFGADFFTFTRLRSEGKMKFPVETTDFFFGVNVSGKQTCSHNYIDWRLRLAHISSHLSDGYSDSGRFRFEPYVYSREFFDLLVSYNTLVEKELNLRPYAGITYIFSTIPDDVVNIIPQAGIETEYYFTDKISFIAGADVKTGGTENDTKLISNIQAGIKFKGINGTSLLLSIYKYDGPSLHGLFFRKSDSYFGLGFQLLFY